MLRMRTPLGILLAAALAAGCGGGSTPAASSEAGGAGSAATAAPAETTGSGGGSGPSSSSGTGSGGEINLGSAVSALSDLENYAFRMEMKATGSSEFIMVPKDGSLVMEGAVILKPEDRMAADITMSTVEDGASPSVMGIRMVDGMSYVNLGGDQWMGSPVEDMASEMSSYQPESMLGGFSSVSGLQAVGDETKNGIATTHYRGEDTTGLGSMFGLPDGSWVTDVWIAKDGGFVVSENVTATAKGGAEEGLFTVTVDLTKANDPTLKVEKPDNVMEIPSVEP
jgi:hypothetical protein